MPSFLRCAFLLLFLLGGIARAQHYQGLTLVEPRLISDTSAIEAGHPFRVGLLLKMAPGWHTYWKYPGDSGSPTKITWTLPPGFTVGDLQWPAPQVDNEPGDLQVYVYQEETLLFVTVTPPATFSSPVAIQAKAAWLVCAQLCVPGHADLSLSLPSGASAASPDAALFQKYGSRIPLIAPFQPKWTSDTKSLTLRVGKLPDAQANPLPASSSGGTAFFFPDPPAKVLVGHPEAKWQDGTLEIHLPLLDGSAGASAIPGVLRFGLHSYEIGSAPLPPAPADSSSPVPLAHHQSPITNHLSLLTALLFGFLGGLILNLMPCVLPVISLKLFSFIKQAGESRQTIFRLGLAFAGGVFAWFLGLAVVLLLLRSTGRQIVWAQQFQNPWFNIGLSVFLFLFALNLLGVFEITLPGRATTRLSDTGNGPAGAFFQGIFATILGTPCTAPYLGTTLAYALTQPPATLIAVFAAVALGMSSPYLLLCANPGWMKFLPRPGLWMVRLKEFMGFLLLATLLWFIWIVGRQLGLDAVIFLGALLLLGGLAAWIFGNFLTPVSSRGMKITGWTALILILAAMATLLLWFRPVPESKTAPDFAAELQSALKTDQIVFVDFTADWCLSCKVNKRVAIDSASVQAAFRQRHVLFLSADWTNGDPAITRVLEENGRVGVPLYLLYPADRSAHPILLPEAITPQIILAALQRI